MRLPTLTLLCICVTLVVGTDKLQLYLKWNILDFLYPTLQARSEAIRTGRFIPENNLPVGIEIWKSKIFITVPRWKEGIPSTLNWVPLHSSVPHPPLIPYPSFQANELGNCKDGLSTVYRIHADKCDRLWVLDTGTFGIGNTTQNPCPYALNIFDLNTDQRIRRYEFRPEDTNSGTFIANIAVDLGPTCSDAYAYMSDELGYGLIVYSYRENKSWRFEHSYFRPDPLRGDFTIDGLNFQWDDEGIFGMSLSPPAIDGYPLLYFSPLASHRQFVVSTRILRNESMVGNSYNDFYALPERGPKAHTTARVMDKFGVEFFNLIDQNAVGCWNSRYDYVPKYHELIDRDDKELIFPCDVKVDRNRNLWVMSDRMSNFLLSKLNYSEINFRLFFAPIDILIQDTICSHNIRFPVKKPSYQITEKGQSFNVFNSYFDELE